MGDNGPNTTEQATAGDGMDKEEKGREGVWALFLSMGCWDRCRRDRQQIRSQGRGFCLRL